jgi:hypothetical protein
MAGGGGAGGGVKVGQQNRQRRAYEMAVDGEPWQAVAEFLGFSSAGRAREAAALHAERVGVPRIRRRKVSSTSTPLPRVPKVAASRAAPNPQRYGPLVGAREAPL